MVDFESCKTTGEKLEFFVTQCDKLHRLAEREIKFYSKKLEPLRCQLEQMEFDSEQCQLLEDYITTLISLTNEENDKAYYDGINDAMVFLMGIMSPENEEM